MYSLFRSRAMFGHMDSAINSKVAGKDVPWIVLIVLPWSGYRCGIQGLAIYMVGCWDPAK